MTSPPMLRHMDGLLFADSRRSSKLSKILIVAFGRLSNSI